MIRAVIFDLDGTIIDNEDLYGKAFCSILKGFGVSCEKVKHTPGIGVRENWEKMKRDLNLAADPTDLSAQTRQVYLDNLAKVRLRPGFIDTVRYLRENGRKIVLATSSTSAIARKVLTTLRIEKLFDVTTFGDEVARKKPAPDLFLKALKKAKVRCREAIIVEDSPAGIAAAKAANIKVAALKTSRFNRTQLSRADYIIDHFEELKKLDRPLRRAQKTCPINTEG